MYFSFTFFLVFHTNNLQNTIVEQIKSSPENREKILAAARNARVSVFPNDLNEMKFYSKEHNSIVVDEFNKLHNLINKNDHKIINGGKPLFYQKISY